MGRNFSLTWTPPNLITPPASDFTIDTTSLLQKITGFGVSDRNAGTISDSDADKLFTTSAGIGLTMLRASFGPTTAYNEDSDPQNAVKAAARGASVWAAPWSPPASWKDSNNENAGGHVLSARYSDWGDTFVGFYNLMAGTYGINLSAMSVQNEPDQFGLGYPQTVYTNAELIAFIKVLGPKLAALSPRPLLMAPESGNWAALWSFADAVLADGVAAAYLDIIATHDYGYATTTHAATTQPLWQTEVSGLNDTGDATITYGLTVASWIHRALTTGNVSAWHYWEINHPTDNEGLLLAGAPTKRLYALGNWSKFIRPGAQRVSVSGSKAGLSVTAFRNGPQVSVVVINSSGSPVSASVGIKANAISTLAPWITSGTAIGAIGTDGNLSNGSTAASISSSLSLSSNALTVSFPVGITTLYGSMS